jgi:acyl-CoA thioesterase YciA
MPRVEYPFHYNTDMRSALDMRNRNVQPRGKLSLRTVAMQADAHTAGDIFSGWIMYLMDLAVGLAAGTRAKGHVATASVSNLIFLQTLRVGDVACIYTNITKVGQTSITVWVEVYALRHNQEDLVRVTEAEFVMVAVDDHRMPRTLPVAA